MLQRFNLAIGSFICLLLLSLSAQAANIEQLWLEAEAAKPHAAIVKWKALLKELPAGQSAGEGLTHEAAKSQLFHAMLKAGETGKDISLIKQAYKLSEEFDIHKKIFADTLIAKSAINLDKKFALKVLKSNKKNALKLKDRRKKSESLHAIALALLTKTSKGKLLFGWDGPEIAEDIVPHITLGGHRAQLMQILAQSQTIHPDNKWGKRLHKLVRINDKAKKKQRNKQLLTLHKEALKSGKFMIALDAISAITDYSTQQETFYKRFKESFDNKQYSRATMIANRIEDGRYAANSWGKLAEHYHQAGEKNRSVDAIERSYQSALSTRRADRRMEALTETAIYAGNSSNSSVAQKALSSAGLLEAGLSNSNSKKANRARASYIKALAENGHLEEAKTRLSKISFSDKSLITLTVAAIAKAMAEEGDADGAFELLSDSSVTKSKRVDKAYYAIAKAFTQKNEFAKAHEAAQQIDDDATQLKIKTYIESREKKASAEGAENSALEAPFFSSLNQKIKALPKSQQEATRLEIAQMLIDEPALPIGSWAIQVKSAKGKDAMLALQATKLAKAGKIEEASRLMKRVDDPVRRAKAYRKLSQEIALHTDLFGFIGDEKDPIIEQTKDEVFAAADATQVKNKQLEERFTQMSLQKERGLEMIPPESSELGLNIPKMDFPERLEFDHEYVKAQLPPLTPFTVNRVYYENSFFINTKFKIAIAYADKNLRAGNTVPEVIYISKGTTSLPLLYDALKSQGLEGYLTRKGKEYTLNNGLLIGPDAGLVIDGSEVSKLYQSKQASAILVNAGHLYITDTSVIGWNVDQQKPAYADYEDRYDFRPFIAGWSRSHTYLSGTEFIAIGYNNHKSYGISFSAGPEKLQQATITEPQRPDGIVVDNSFDNVYYGFYSYEADNVALIGNEYKDNIVYGIDPHDRSRWLTIAYNTAYGAEKKHGIIISREVNDSSYIGNLSFDNKGSGFMIDRLSTGTFVYGNTAFGNKQDGLTLFESSCNYIASNNFFKNKSMGIRVRNSQDNGIFFNRLADNRQGGITGYTSELLDDPAHKRRNFALDPYADVAAMTLVGNLIEGNGTGVIGDNLSALFLRGNRFVNQSPKMFNGEWFTEHSYFTSQYDIQNKGVFMGERCPRGKWIHHNCRFRKDGLYRGDGQSGLERRVTSSSCKVPSKQDAHS